MGANRLRDITAFALIISHLAALALCAASSYLHGIGTAVQIALYLSPLFAYYVYTVLNRIGKDINVLGEGEMVRRSYAVLAIGITSLFGVCMILAVLAFATGLIPDAKAA